MDWIKTVNHAIQYMEDHLTEQISVSDIAAHVNLSVFHFHRAFSMITGLSPAEYLRKRRLSQAAQELVNGDEKVIDIALKYGYETPESFTKAFTRFHGISPMQAKKGSPVQFMSRYTVRIAIEGGQIMEFTIKKLEPMDLLVHAKSFHAETSEAEIPKFWDAYYADEAYRKIPGYLGVCAQTKTDSDEFEYGIGCNASDVEGVPEGFKVIHIPAYTWAVFKCVGPSPKAIQDMWERIYKEWLPVSDYEIIPDYDIENYLPGDPSSQDYVSEICIPVKKSGAAV
ncbi:MAG: AraC family transcriptional regulator [Lachnospiraceae bacterium]|nr:AraC family transcriptional regulator [Lachnospiraceae bacterium]